MKKTFFITIAMLAVLTSVSMAQSVTISQRNGQSQIEVTDPNGKTITYTGATTADATAKWKAAITPSATISSAAAIPSEHFAVAKAQPTTTVSATASQPLAKPVPNYNGSAAQTSAIKETPLK